MATVGLICGVLSPPGVWAYQRPAHRELPDLDRRERAQAQPPPVRPSQAAARERLRQRVPRVRAEFDPVRQTPRWVASPESFLTGPAGTGKGVSPAYARPWPAEDPHRPVKAFVEEYQELFGYGADTIARARLRRDDTSPVNGLRSVVWEQQLDGLAIYEGVLVGHITRDGELVNVASLFLENPAAAAEAGTPNRAALLAVPPIGAPQAVVNAALSLEEGILLATVRALDEPRAGAERSQRFKAGHLPAEAEVKLVWLPLEAATLRLCWQVELTRHAGNERYRVLVDVSTGEVLVRRCLTVYLTDATYRVYTSDSPSPFSPSHRAPSTNQPPLVPRQLLTLAALNTNASPLGWIHDGENETRGNNVDAHLDRNADDAPDLPRPQGAPFRVFDFPLDLDQSPTTYGPASAVQLFYWCNWMHDQLYDLGFTEAAGNFQKDNFGRGGRGSDPVLADAQDGSGVNNANFTPTYDGTPPRIQMFLFDGPQPGRDGSLDAEIVLHEYSHGLTDRLVGGGVGLGSLQGYGLGEGWSDWYALALLSEAADDPDGGYAVGGYATWQFYGLKENYYYGIRRYPYSTDMAINPLTFKDIDPFEADWHLGVPINPVFGFGDPAEVHNQGEVWCAALWEVRANLVFKHGFATGNRLALQLVTDGLKLSPPNPNFLQARDAIIQADLVNTGGANFNDLWAGFAKRGMGFSAQAPATLTTIGVREAFDLPDALLLTLLDSATFSGSAGGPFFPECKTFVLTNHSGQPLNWVVSSTVPWLTASADSGTLEPASATSVSVCVNAQAAALPLGVYAGPLVFSNVTSGIAQSRELRLRVLGFAGLPFWEDFESGQLKSYWSVSGLGPYRTKVTTDNTPHGGKYHVTMDTWANGNYARNELTLGIDLAGYTNVMLRFWTKEFGDDPDGPPASPFVDGADFDGVAVSANGIQWYEVQGLRSLPLSYTEVMVNLDDAVTALGLTYNSQFQVRFNQYDNFGIVLDGLAFDDIAIAGVPARRFHVTVPAQGAEGGGVLAQPGTITLGAPVPAALVVQLVSSDPKKVAVPATVTIPAGADSATFELRLLDNQLVDGTQPVTVSVSARNHVPASAVLNVTDNETAQLEVHVDAKAREGDPPGKRRGTVKVKPRPDNHVTVTLTSSDPTEVRVPATVVIPAGQKEVGFDLAIVDDLDLDGPQRATITAHVAHWKDGCDTIQIRDNDKRQLSVALPALASEGNGVLTNAGVVRLAARQTNDMTVSLASSNPREVLVPPRVIIPAGQFSAPFNVTILDDTKIDGPQQISVTATAKGFLVASAQMSILDDETPLAPYQPNPADRAGEVPVSLVLTWASGVGETVVNGDFETGNFVGWQQINAGLGGLLINDGNVNPEGPDEALPPFAGSYAALVQQTGSGSHELFQDVTIPAEAKSAVLSWAQRVRNHYDRFTPLVQEFRMEVRSTSDAVREVLYRTQPGDELLGNWIEQRHDLIQYRGQTIRLAFAEVDTLMYFNLHLDNVSLSLGDASATSYEVYFGPSPTLGPAQLLGTPRTPFWELPELALNTTYYWQIVTRRGAAQTRGPIWQFATRGPGPVARLDWAPIASPQFVNQPFPVTLTARDDLGQVAAGYQGPVHLRLLPGTGTRSAVVVSEMDPGSKDRVEFLNASGRWLDLSGWHITLYDGFDWPNPRIDFVVPTNSLSPPGGVFVLNRFGTAPGVYPNFYTATNIVWDYVAVGGRMAVLVRDAVSNLVDFVCAADANPALIANPVAIPPDAWSGPALAALTNSPRTYQRMGQADHDSAADWVAVENSIGSVNPNLLAPFTNSVPLVVTPDTLTGFVHGVWRGELVLAETHELVTLLAEDTAGHWVVSAPFTVIGSNDLAVTIRDDPDLPLVADDVTYLITVTNAGPAIATGVWLTNRLPAAVEFVSATNPAGACTQSNGTVICCLGNLPGGAQAEISLQVRPLVPGAFTNTVSVTRAERDGHPANNTAIAVTTASYPRLTMAKASVLEGDPDMPDAVFHINLSAPSRLPVSVTFSTRDGTAREGTDYRAVRTNLVFAPGTVRLSVPVPILDDLISEEFERFTAQLQSPTNATVPAPVTYGAILDDDPLPDLSIDDFALVEGPKGTVTNAVFQVRLSQPSALPITVRYSTRDGVVPQTEPITLPAITNLPGLGSATAIEDYVPASDTLTIPPGATNQTILIAINGDGAYEGSEAFSLVLSEPSNGTLGDPVGLCAILDDDEAELARYAIGQVPSPRYAGIPFPLTVTAHDGLDRIVTNFSGTVRLSGFPDQAAVVLGTETREWKYPLNAFFHDGRLQVIYPASQIGQTGTISALTLEVQTPPGQILSRWTVRMKHTPLTRYTTPAWETNGWTTVYSRDLLVRGTGGALCYLDTPFAYNGTESLMVDFTFDNASYTSDGACVCSAASEPRSAYFETDSAFGDPLTWSAATAPPPLATNLVPNLRLLIGPSVEVTPGVLGPFVSGVWTGDVTVAAPVAAMRLRVVDTEERQVVSAVFAVESGSDPTVSSNAVRITAVTLEQANARIRFLSRSGQRYRVEWTDDLGADRWFPVADGILGTGAEVQIIDPGGGTQPRRFYRISVRPPAP